MTSLTLPSRLRLGRSALISNWRWLAEQSGPAACGAAIKADGYGLGAQAILECLSSAGCRDFFVASWGEAAALDGFPAGLALSVLHGIHEEDMAFAIESSARPVLNTLKQSVLWKETGLPCDVMVDSGMNRLGIAIADVLNGALDGLQIETLMSHLASADEANSPQNADQLAAFAALAGRTGAKRMSLANSAGILLGPEYCFDLTRPGLALYGGIPGEGARAGIRQVAYPEARIVQRRTLRQGEAIGYNATYRAPNDQEVAILNIGYADGYLRGFSGCGKAGQGRFPVIGRVSMDLTAICVDAAPDLAEGDWVGIDYALDKAASVAGLSQYELLTGLGQRFERIWC